jgi:hypothetical protein
MLAGRTYRGIRLLFLVFDPNIMPDPATGRCAAIAPSSLQNATGNCLTSIAALQSAMVTNNSGIASANVGNPIWETFGKPITQVELPGITLVSEIRNPNSNMDIFFAVNDSNPYPPNTGSQQSIIYPMLALGTAEIVALLVLGGIGLTPIEKANETKRGTRKWIAWKPFSKTWM